MKLNFLNSRTINIVVSVLVVSFGVLLLLSILPFMIKTGGSSSDSSATMYEMEKTLVPIDALVPDSISHRRFLRLTDSVKQRRYMKNGTLAGGSFSFMFIGATALQRCEDCSIWDNDKSKVKEHFISLHWWTLDTVGVLDPVRYYVKEGKPYVRKVICKPIGLANGNNFRYKCDEVDIAVPFRYDTWTKSMLLPVSNTTFSILNIILACFAILFILYFLYYIVGGFIKVLLEIATGTPFSDRNVRRLKMIAMSFLLIPLILFLLNLLIRVVFYKYFTADLKLSTDAWGVFWKPAVLSVIFAALYFAFKQGKKLKDEQDLTV
ncbi:DUF2975 domain-containing protein [Pedobacter hiemivivus]|uniref:DUF2975 domain-containing protein n=2 Tax=Pedobacter hiemivivus TaxID=2530454 RepID=A0A4U1GCC6_9SPHI|nr:DUF2975 domain-containing protein [Pedobacter hiemivivus]